MGPFYDYSIYQAERAMTAAGFHRAEMRPGEFMAALQRRGSAVARPPSAIRQLRERNASPHCPSR
jgi:hypothetical protein